MDIEMDCKMDGAMGLMLGLKMHGGNFEREMMTAKRITDEMLKNQLK
jgi:hypothetical protein